MDTLIKKLYTLSVLAERLAETDEKYAKLSKAAEQIAQLTEEGVPDDEVVKIVLDLL